MASFRIGENLYIILDTGFHLGIHAGEINYLSPSFTDHILTTFFLPPAAKNLFEKRFLDFQKLFIKMVSIVFVLCDPLWLISGGGFELL
jgi:hypothetical protein